jgi:hypothetical protein
MLWCCIDKRTLMPARELSSSAVSPPEALPRPRCPPFLSVDQLGTPLNRDVCNWRINWPPAENFASSNGGSTAVSFRRYGTRWPKPPTTR